MNIPFRHSLGSLPCPVIPRASTKFCPVRKIDENILSCANSLSKYMSMKGDVADSRRSLAHPIPLESDRLLKFPTKLGSAYADLEPIEIDLFKYLVK